MMLLVPDEMMTKTRSLEFEGRQFYKSRMVRRWTLAFGTLVILLMGINYCVFVSLRHQIIAREELQLLRIADVTAAAVDHMFVSTRKALESIRDNVKPGASPDTAHELLKTTAEAAPFIRALAIVRIDGHYLHSSRALTPPNVDLSGSPIVAYFASVAGDMDAHHVTDPTRNTIDNQWQVLAGVPTRDDDGDVREVIAAVIDTKIIFSELMSQSQGDGSVSLVNGEMLLIASSPWHDDRIGHSLASTPAFRQLIARNAMAASGVVEDVDNKEPVVAATIWLRDGRFALAVTRPLSAVLYEWSALSKVIAGVSLFIMFGLSLTATLSIRDAMRLKARGKALRESERRFKEAKEIAERAGAAKADFLANMSHEIRTPLNGIIGYADLALEDQAVSPETRRNISRVFEASNSLRVIIDDILDFSKIEARGVELSPKAFYLAELADNCVSIVKPKADETGLDIVSRLDGDVPVALLGDASRLRQVLINLLNNAVKFTAKGSVTFTVSCESLSETEASVRFSIADTGIGISKEDQLKLFQRFNQADSSISRNYGGTGLGLAISKRIVDAMDGELRIESEAGKGSTFWFEIRLPVADPADIEDRNGPAVENANPLRILSVDDVEMNRDLCKAILSRAGHQVTLADGGKSAITLARKQNFDIILMDIQMPGMDGLEATRQIRALAGDKGNVPIIALTANVMPDQVSRYKAAGMDDHVGKPIVKGELLAKLSKWSADRTQIADQQPAAAPPLVPVHDDEMLVALRMMDEPELIDAFVTNLRATIAAAPASWRDDAASGEDRQQLAAAAHKAVNVAGQLGFAELAEAYRSLEVACLEAQPVAPALKHLHTSIGRALPEIENISAAA